MSPFSFQFVLWNEGPKNTRKVQEKHSNIRKAPLSLIYFLTLEKRMNWSKHVSGTCCISLSGGWWLVQGQRADYFRIPSWGKDLLLMAMAAWGGGAVGCPPAHLQPSCRQDRAQGHPGPECFLLPPQLHLPHGVTHRNHPYPILFTHFSSVLDVI